MMDTRTITILVVEDDLPLQELALMHAEKATDRINSLAEKDDDRITIAIIPARSADEARSAYVKHRDKIDAATLDGELIGGFMSGGGREVAIFLRESGFTGPMIAMSMSDAINRQLREVGCEERSFISCSGKKDFFTAFRYIAYHTKKQ